MQFFLGGVGRLHGTVYFFYLVGTQSYAITVLSLHKTQKKVVEEKFKIEIIIKVEIKIPYVANVRF